MGSVEVPFRPSRVVLQDFTGVPAVVDFAAMRDAVKSLGGNPENINPQCPSDLVIDHSVQVDISRASDSRAQNEALEFQRNHERFLFLKWGAQAFHNMLIVPPGSGIVHQVNLEYLARVCFNKDGLLYPDSVVGTDSHTTMINGLGVVGWGVGGIEAEAVMLGQPISMVLAKKAVEMGLKVAPYIKTSLSPGSGVVTYYLEESGVIPYLETLGFSVVGYGCLTCIGNSGPLPEPVVGAVEKGDLVCAGVLSGNRNFEGRIHPHTRANYLASPLFVIAYAIAGRVDIDFEKEPLATLDAGKEVFLRDIWPSRSDIQAVESKYVIPRMFEETYAKITSGNPNWNKLSAPTSTLYPWDASSTYIRHPPFFKDMTVDLPEKRPIRMASVLLNLGDSVTTDHISPAGSIPRNSPAARYLASRGLTPRDFNSFGSRRGNDAVMARGTFGNIRLVNKLVGKAGPKTLHIPSNNILDVFDAAEQYREAGSDLIVLAGKDYGCGSSRDWAAKGPFLLGVRAVIAESYERIHRSNLVGMGIVPLQYKVGDTAESLGLTGKEKFDILLPSTLVPGQDVPVTTDSGKSFNVTSRFDTDLELLYYAHGGILNYMVRKLVKQTTG